ncbi:UDP-3-O-acyl-N-acetylglucosamine deacetylase [Hypericibacter adhaerens]|nr:UDP-3-O-acyl-N-acetylglucosamine deacetylase [Hypericibacter adhaerens]
MPDISTGFAGIGHQRTLCNSVSCSGIGLHSGRPVRMTIHPAPAGSGIRFRRTDLSGDKAIIAADWRQVCDLPLCTALSNEAGTRVATVEHVLAALSACGVDNAEIAVDAPELPIMDGSAAPFLFLIECAGTVPQPSPRRAIAVRKTVMIEDAERRVALHPADAFTVAIEVDYGPGNLSPQSYCGRVTADGFRAEIARARTYGFLADAEALRAAGLARGASLDNAVVVSDGKVLNEGGLRYANELARHKALDVIGDMALAGAPLKARFEGRRSGHRLHHRLLAALFADSEAWDWAPILEEQPSRATAAE